MLDGSLHESRAIELDPDMLSTPFRVQTKWHVITGTVSSGKTTLVDQLADQGFQTVPEIGRLFFEREIARGRTKDELRGNPAACQRAIMDMQLRFECGLRATDVVFLDRALPDCLAFCRVNGVNPNEILAECFRHRYASVVALDRLPFQRDGLRNDDEAWAALLDEWIRRDYGALGYSVVRVPVMPPEERLAFVLERLSEQGLI